MLDKILEKYNLKFEDLNHSEQETLMSMVESVQKNQLTVSKIKEYITSMRESVQSELAKAELGTNDDLFLKARMRNYILLETILTSPKRIQEQLESMLSQVKA